MRAQASCQPTLDARRVVVRVVAVAGFGGEVDAADEGDSVVDDDRLLVMAVHRPFLAVEGALDLRVADQLVAHLPHVASRRPKQRQRRAGPGEHADIEPFRQLCQEVAKDERLGLSRECEVRGEEPAGQMHVRSGALELSSDHRQCLGTVDQDVDRVA